MWRRYFKLVKLVPGKVIVQGHGTIDFAGDVSVELCQQLWENDFEFLEITEEGKRELYGVQSSEFKVESLKLNEAETLNIKPETLNTEEPVGKRKRTYKKKG